MHVLTVVLMPRQPTPRHPVHCPHSLHPPSTKTGNKNIISYVRVSVCVSVRVRVSVRVSVRVHVRVRVRVHLEGGDIFRAEAPKF